MSGNGLLAPCDVAICRPNGNRDLQRGWRFLRHPEHWAVPWVLKGHCLVEMQAPSVQFSDRRPCPWAVTTPRGQVRGIPERVALGFLEADRLEREPHYREALNSLSKIRDRARPLRAFLERDLPRLGLERGDVLLATWHHRRPLRCHRLPSDHLAYLRAQLLEDETLVTDLDPLQPWSLAEDVIGEPSGWDRTQGACVSVFRGRRVTSIPAPSEEAAVRVLIRSVGCRMPER